MSVFLGIQHLLLHFSYYRVLNNWPAHPNDPQGIRVASVIEFSVDLCVGVFWANFLISGRRHVIVARVTIEYAAGWILRHTTKRNVMHVLNNFAAVVNLKWHERAPKAGPCHLYQILID